MPRRFKWRLFGMLYVAFAIALGLIYLIALYDDALLDRFWFLVYGVLGLPTLCIRIVGYFHVSKDVEYLFFAAWLLGFSLHPFLVTVVVSFIRKKIVIPKRSNIDSITDPR